MLASMIFPLVQLIIPGNAFGGKIRDARLAIVDEDGGTQALKIREAFDSVRSNIRTFLPLYYDNEKAVEDVRNGKLEGRSLSLRSFRAASTKIIIRRSPSSWTTAITS